MMKIEGSGSNSQRHGSADPDPDLYQNVMDPQHCPQASLHGCRPGQTQGKGDQTIYFHLVPLLFYASVVYRLKEAWGACLFFLLF
jgi:hypothetical protein